MNLGNLICVDDSLNIQNFQISGQSWRPKDKIPKDLLSIWTCFYYKPDKTMLRSLCNTKPPIIFTALWQCVGFLQRINKWPQSCDPLWHTDGKCVCRWGGRRCIIVFYTVRLQPQEVGEDISVRFQLCFRQFQAKSSWVNRDLRGWSRWGNSRTSLRTAPLWIYLRQQRGN